jgi:hypothetical protein
VTLLRMPNGLTGFRFDRVVDAIDRRIHVCRHRSHAAWRQIRTSPPDTSRQFLRQSLLKAVTNVPQSGNKHAGSLLKFQFRSASLSEFQTGIHLRYYK